MRRWPSWGIALGLTQLVIWLSTFLGSGKLQASSLVPCVNPSFAQASFGFAALVLLNAVLLSWLHRPVTAWAGAALLVLCIFSLWMGAYGLSPLSYGRGGIPVLSGFRLTRFGLRSYHAATGAIVVTRAGSPMEIEPILLANAGTDCQWHSDNGGAIDAPSSCDIAYEAPPGVTYDVMHLHVQTDCGLPEISAELRLSIAP